jgi:hypothetical protein
MEALRADNKALAQSLQDTQASAVAAQSAVEDERAAAAAAFQVCFAAGSALSCVDLRCEGDETPEAKESSRQRHSAGGTLWQLMHAGMKGDQCGRPLTITYTVTRR